MPTSTPTRCRLAFHGVLLHGLGDRDYAESPACAARVQAEAEARGRGSRVSTPFLPAVLRRELSTSSGSPAEPGQHTGGPLQLLGPAGQRRWALLGGPHCQPSLQPHLGALVRQALSRRQSLWLPGDLSPGVRDGRGGPGTGRCVQTSRTAAEDAGAGNSGSMGPGLRPPWCSPERVCSRVVMGCGAGP